MTDEETIQNLVNANRHLAKVNQQLHERLLPYDRERWFKKGTEMTGTTAIEEDKKLIGFGPEKIERPQLRVITGDKEQPPEDWLMTLPVGEVFFAKEKKDTTTAFVQCFEIEQKFSKVVNLTQYYPDEREMKLNVLSLQFSRLFELVESY